ncbi:MAG: translation initiation factor eIF-2B subunit alpha [Stictis urceolatum]|nr:translation initiation factor eIF-2B subunit alpha [Stictis urceolata]
MTRMYTTGNVPRLHQNGKGPFDIVQTYRTLLSSDPDLTMPVAAIESLVSLLAATPNLSTISETLDLLAGASAQLKRAAANPVSLSAGTDLFTRYIVSTLRAPSAAGLSGSPGPHDFHAVRNHLLNNGRLFVARAKDARRAIARLAARFVREGQTVLTNGGSRVVGLTLTAAAEAQTRDGGAPRFKVVYVTSGSGRAGVEDGREVEGRETIEALRRMQVPVAEIPESAVAYSMAKVDIALVGAEGVVESGGVISRLGTYQLGLLARAKGKPVYVVAESHKFVRQFPLGQEDLGVEQRVLEFTTEVVPEGGEEERIGDKTPNVKSVEEYFQSDDGAGAGQEANGLADAVDYTPPELITALITESGVMTPSAVSEELIKIWY